MASKSTTSTLFLSLLFLLLLPNTTAIPSTTISSAAEILSNTNHHNSMSLTLPLISAALSLPSLPSATLFSPSDSAFSISSSSGQPSLSLLKFHFCPRSYSPSDLLSLSYGSLLPTLLPNSSLTITSTVFDDFVSLNGVKIGFNNSPVFDDGFFVVYSVDGFFGPSYRVSDSVSELSPSYNTPECHVGTTASGAYWEASAALRTRGYSLMAGFLDVQVSQFGQESTKGKNVITVFAPKDEAVEGYFRNYSDWGSVFLRHVVGCEMSWGDLVALNDGVILGTFLKGFGLKIEKNSEGNLILNQNFTVDFPDFYRSERVLVHGLSGILNVPPEDSKPADQEGVHGGSYSDHGEF